MNKPFGMYTIFDDRVLHFFFHSFFLSLFFFFRSVGVCVCVSVCFPLVNGARVETSDFLFSRIHIYPASQSVSQWMYACMSVYLCLCECVTMLNDYGYNVQSVDSQLKRERLSKFVTIYGNRCTPILCTQRYSRCDCAWVSRDYVSIQHQKWKKKKQRHRRDNSNANGIYSLEISYIYLLYMMSI